MKLFIWVLFCDIGELISSLMDGDMMSHSVQEVAVDYGVSIATLLQ
jgi:hypothetical protein